MIQCERCKSIHDGTYGSGRFCSVQCARSFSTSSMSEESKVKRIDGLNKARRSSARARKGKVGKPHTPETRALISNSLTSYWNGNDEARQELAEKKTGVSMNEETRHALSASLKLAHKEGRNRGWVTLRSDPVRSEEVWAEALDERQVPYTRSHTVKHSDIGLATGRHYQLDFLVCGVVDLEIDGKMHQYEERMQHDAKRNIALEGAGFLVRRYPWKGQDPREDGSLDDFIGFLKGHGLM